MRSARVWRRLLGVEHTVVEDVDLEGDGAEEVLVARVRPTRSRRGRCSRCERRCRGYDRGDGRRRWRTLDVGTVPAYLEADAPRVACPTVCSAPWRLYATKRGRRRLPRQAHEPWQRQR